MKITATDLEAEAAKWIGRAADALEHLTIHAYTREDIRNAAAIGSGYNALAYFALLEENRAADLERTAKYRREDLERIAAADLAQRGAEAIVEEAHISMKRLADVQIGAWGEQYPHLVEALEASGEVKSGD